MKNNNEEKIKFLWQDLNKFMEDGFQASQIICNKITNEAIALPLINANTQNQCLGITKRLHQIELLGGLGEGEKNGK